jgi:5-methylcytosine-specific restriction endonuclease McrA
MSRAQLTAEQRAFVTRHDKCVVCGSTYKLQLDHIVPRSKGGIDEESNWQVLCIRCNSIKKDRSNEEWLKYWAPVERPPMIEIMNRTLSRG